MLSERWQRIERLLQSALALPYTSRKAYLDRECGDADLRREVESLLSEQTMIDSSVESHDPDATRTMLTRAPDAGTSHRMGACGLGSYKILGFLGKGGMGEVYRAHDGKLGRDVAIKTLPPEFSRDAARLGRFQREARTLASLNHPNIAAIYGLEESEGTTFLILELVDGETLQAPQPIPKALDYARQIAEGVEAAHDKGIVHRDLKPANVKVTPQGRVKVLDFGLAKAVWSGEAAQNVARLSAIVGPQTVRPQTMAGNILGTPPYMSPEQARGEEVDARTDIWAFGCVLYELLAGKRAFSGATLSDIVEAILERDPDWKALPARTPPKIVELLKRCLEKDVQRRIQKIRDAHQVIEKVQKRRSYWPLAAAAVVAATVVAGAELWLRAPVRPANRDQWVQLTKFPDSVSQPALSPDGRMLAFVRGYSTFYGQGQIYAKPLPDGEARQMTSDDFMKMSPAFSPDGSRLAYTTVDRQFKWDTWTVPVSGGEPRRWLTDASGLVWKDPRTVLFSELLVGSHMAVESSKESRAGERAVYVPPRQSGMAHRSYPSPDGKWALIVEMDPNWLPCRVVPMDGSSQGKRVGPQTGACTFAAWSPDGKWMYFSSSAGGGFHIWRQRFPDGRPEQVTSGPTEEEGIAMAADGQSFITAVGQRQRSVSLHTEKGERQISLEGYAYRPKFTPDFKRLIYRVLKGSQVGSDPAELWIADLDSGRTEALLPGVSSLGSVYDVSRDGHDVIFPFRDASGANQVWVAAVDRSSPPHRIPNADGAYPFFGPDGEIYFRALDSFVYRIQKDGSGKQRMLEHPVAELVGVSPDGKWLVVWSVDPDAEGAEGKQQSDFAFPLDGGKPIRIVGDDSLAKWSPDRTLFFLEIDSGGTQAGAAGKTYVLPIPPGKMLPDFPKGGFRSEGELAKFPGVRVIESADVAPGATNDAYAFSKGTTQRNLYRIPLR